MTFKRLHQAGGCWILASIMFFGLPADVAPAAGRLAYPTSPEAISKEISKRGPKEVLSELWRDRVAWDRLRAGIATGAESWLTVALLLRPASDAGATRDLRLALGEALGSSPERVLQLSLKPHDIAAVCSGVDIDDPRFDSYELATAEVERRVQTVSTITEPQLEQAKADCLAELRASDPHLRRFYRVE